MEEGTARLSIITEAHSFIHSFIQHEHAEYLKSARCSAQNKIVIFGTSFHQKEYAVIDLDICDDVCDGELRTKD